ncbi:MAG: glyoxylate reductase [Desulfurococcaceae archaeon]
MSKPKLFISRELWEDVIERLSMYYDVEVWNKYQSPPYEKLVEKAKEVDAILSLLSDKIDCNLLSSATNLRIVSQLAVGYDNIDVSCATRLGIYVTNTPGVLTDATAELTWALILAVARRIVEADYFVRSGEWEATNTAWHPKMMLGIELKGKVLGVVGAGRIGFRVAEIGARGFGMKVIYNSRSRNPIIEDELKAEFRDIDKLLEEADIVALHVPLTKETYHMIDENRLRKMKRTAILVNVARGAVVDTEALVKALKEGWIAGAGLDVFENEPLYANHPLATLKNVVLTPHIGSATHETRHRVAELAAENLIAFSEGKVPPYLINREVLLTRPPGFNKRAH